MVVSSVSPERWETTAVKLARLAISIRGTRSGTNLVDLDEDGVGVNLNALQALSVGNKEVAADELIFLPRRW